MNPTAAPTITDTGKELRLAAMTIASASLELRKLCDDLDARDQASLSLGIADWLSNVDHLTQAARAADLLRNIACVMKLSDYQALVLNCASDIRGNVAQERQEEIEALAEDQAAKKRELRRRMGEIV